MRAESLIVRIWKYCYVGCDYKAEDVATVICADPTLVKEMLEAGVTAGVFSKTDRGYRKMSKARRKMKKPEQFDWVDGR